MKPVLRFLSNPRKASLVLAVFAFLAVSVGAAWWYFKEDPAVVFEKEVADGALKLREDQIKKLNLDSDQDGLRDWEEAIFRTDSNNPDSDGDGTKDGEEVAHGRDPALRGPKDKILPKDLETKTAATLNVTGDFTEKFLRDPISQIITGGRPSIDPKAVEAYTERLLNRSILSAAPQIKPGEIKIGADDTIEAIEEYFKSFSPIFLSLQARGENEMDITVRAFKEQEYGELAKLDAYAESYDKAIIKLKILSTPLSLKTFHADILNYLLKFKLSVELMRNAEADPIQAMLAVNERTKMEGEFEVYLKQSEEKLFVILKSKAK